MAKATKQSRTRNRPASDMQSRLRDKIAATEPTLGLGEWEFVPAAEVDGRQWGDMIRWGYVTTGGAERTKQLGVMTIAGLLCAAEDGSLMQLVEEQL